MSDRPLLTPEQIKLKAQAINKMIVNNYEDMWEREFDRRELVRLSDDAVKEGRASMLPYRSRLSRLVTWVKE